MPATEMNPASFIQKLDRFQLSKKILDRILHDELEVQYFMSHILKLSYFRLQTLFTIESNYMYRSGHVSLSSYEAI